MATAFFDLDRTLIDCNSGRLWVGEEWRAGNISVRDVAWASWWLGRYSLGWDEGLEGVFDTVVARMAGQSEAEMSARVHEWFRREVVHRLRPGARAALDRHRDAGDRLVLCTSSSCFAAEAATRAYGLDDWIATTFEIADGRFTGRVDTVALGAGKRTATEAWAEAQGIDLAEAAFYTDSYSDLPLMEVVGRPVAINPDRALRKEAQRRAWAIEDWGRSS